MRIIPTSKYVKHGRSFACGSLQRFEQSPHNNDETRQSAWPGQIIILQQSVQLVGIIISNIYLSTPCCHNGSDVRGTNQPAIHPSVINSLAAHAKCVILITPSTEYYLLEGRCGAAAAEIGGFIERFRSSRPDCIDLGGQMVNWRDFHRQKFRSFRAPSDCVIPRHFTDSIREQILDSKASNSLKFGIQINHQYPHSILFRKRPAFYYYDERSGRWLAIIVMIRKYSSYLLT